ncbi:hypothetical protein ACJRO7_026768 [Eucalyptus globulus]|uniref:CCHC-type domain-containing protein n=1 Tax=Eucalyptus globulus TaxID=34317 RepID=A0ABD3JQ31_EUCGL
MHITFFSFSFSFVRSVEWLCFVSAGNDLWGMCSEREENSGKSSEFAICFYGDRSRDCGHDCGPSRDSGGKHGGGGGECFKCDKPGHCARECPCEGGWGGRYGGRDDRYGVGGGGHYGPDRNGDRSRGKCSYNQDRSGPYERCGTGNFRPG